MITQVTLETFDELYSYLEEHNLFNDAIITFEKLPAQGGSSHCNFKFDIDFNYDEENLILKLSEELSGETFLFQVIQYLGMQLEIKK